MALLTVMALLLVVSTLGAAVLLSSSTESRIAFFFRTGLEARHAADAAAERALLDLIAEPDWSLVLSGAVRSRFVDGLPSGPRSPGYGVQLVLDEVRNLVNCGHAVICSDAELDAVTAARPWGANNPRWQLYAYAPLALLLPSGVESRSYAVVLVGDDPAETDGNPLRDAAGVTDPGHGIVLVRAEAFGPGGARRAVELTVARVMRGSPAGPAVRILGWRTVS